MKRRLLIVAVFLLAGAVVNVTVAWGIAAWSCVEGSPGTIVVHVERLQNGSIIDQACRGVGLQVEYVYTARINHYLDLRVTSGWPMLAMNWRSWKRFGFAAPRYPLRRAYGNGTLDVFERDVFMAAVRARREVASRPRRVVATAPIWPGFTVNTFFYSVVMWLLLCSLFTLRRVIRIRRGLCPACAYPARPYPVGESLICSECGKALPERAREIP